MQIGNLGSLNRSRTGESAPTPKNPAMKSSEPKNSAEPEKPNVRVAAFLDGTEKVVEPFLIKRIDDLEKFKAQAGDKAEARAVVYRSGVSPKRKALTGALTLAAHVAIPAAFGLVGGPVGVAFGLAIDALLFVDGHTMKGLGEIESAVLHRRQTKEPDWKGRRNYQITPDRTDRFDSTILGENSHIRKTSSRDLSNLLYSQFSSQDPNTTDVLLVGGHGLGFRQVAGMTGRNFAGGISKKPDIILMESCLEGNLETLSQLKNQAKYAILSEEPLSVDALPVQEMLLEASTPETDAGIIAKNMVAAAQEHQGETIKTLAAYDLGRVKGTLNDLDSLGGALLKEMEAGKQKEIQAAVKEARKLGKSRLTPLNTLLIGFSDLGDFLTALQGKNLATETMELAKAAEKSLDEMVVAKIGDKKHENLSGVSFLSRNLLDKLPLNQEVGQYQDAPLPANWKRFIEKLEEN